MMLLHCCVCNNMYGHVKNSKQYSNAKDYSSGYCPKCWENTDLFKFSKRKFIRRVDAWYWKRYVAKHVILSK